MSLGRVGLLRSPAKGVVGNGTWVQIPERQLLRYSLIGKATDFESVLLRSSRSTAAIRELVESGLLRLS